MTAVLAIKKVFEDGPCVVIAADSLISRGYTKVKAFDSCKLINFPDFVVGFSGICTMQHVLQELSQNKVLLKKKFMKMKNPLDVIAFSREVYAVLHERLEESRDNSGDFQIGDLVIATPQKIFVVDKYSYVSESDTLVSTGCVDDLLAGVVMSLYDMVETPEALEELAIFAIEKAEERSIGVEGPIKVIKVD